MKLHLLICAWALTTTFAADLQSLVPLGGVTDETPSLESAYPNEVYIARTADPNGGAVHYEVRVYAPELLDVKRNSAMLEVAIVVCDERGTKLLSTHVEVSGVAHIPPSKEEFRLFSFSVHESLERTTAINIGRYNSMRVLFTKYRLPLKAVDNPKAHR